MRITLKFILSIFHIIFFISTNAYSESLFSDESFVPLIADYRAVAVGDNVTIVIVESSRARANDGSSGSATLSATAAGQLSTTRREELGGATLDLGFGTSQDSSTKRDGLLKAVLTADVIEISPNGNLLLHGKQHLLVNGENQYISVTGWVSPYYIDENNTVLSSRLSQTKIVYSGKDPDGISFWNKVAGFFCCPMDMIFGESENELEELESESYLENEVFDK
ncbi:flagellar basal body L-ring protein FlgH [uncultured Microbulbifer sp.]|uniref:flagellar basal body L-ring protein FlgH n=1 Tax=uncultured Microbulbifer sp. TaxID=348147 RepID=UPI0026384126|nr:flagellar basal body L-ring protein FlgH [uncultured Microbulbifer sp.]